MIIVLDTDNMWLIFSLERRDFSDGIGHKFINELVVKLPDDSYITDKFMGKIIFTVDISAARVFIDIYRKHFPVEYHKQLIKLI